MRYAFIVDHVVTSLMEGNAYANIIYGVVGFLGCASLCLWYHRARTRHDIGMEPLWLHRRQGESLDAFFLWYRRSAKMWQAMGQVPKIEIIKDEITPRDVRRRFEEPLIKHDAGQGTKDGDAGRKSEHALAAACVIETPASGSAMASHERDAETSADGDGRDSSQSPRKPISVHGDSTSGCETATQSCNQSPSSSKRTKTEAFAMLEEEAVRKHYSKVEEVERLVSFLVGDKNAKFQGPSELFTQNKGTTMTPRCVEATNNRGHHFTHHRAYAEALWCYEIAAFFCHDDARLGIFLVNCALAYLLLGKLGDAVYACDKALACNQLSSVTQVKAFYRSAVAYASLKNILVAKARLRRVLELDSENEQAKLFLQEIENADSLQSAVASSASDPFVCWVDEGLQEEDEYEDDHDEDGEHDDNSEEQLEPGWEFVQTQIQALDSQLYALGPNGLFHASDVLSCQYGTVEKLELPSEPSAASPERDFHDFPIAAGADCRSTAPGAIGVPGDAIGVPDDAIGVPDDDREIGPTRIPILESIVVVKNMLVFLGIAEDDTAVYTYGDHWRKIPCDGARPLRRGFSATTIKSDIFTFGGICTDSDTVYADVHRLDCEFWKWHACTIFGYAPPPRYFHTATHWKQKTHHSRGNMHQDWQTPVIHDPNAHSTNGHPVSYSNNILIFGGTSPSSRQSFAGVHLLRLPDAQSSSLPFSPNGPGVHNMSAGAYWEQRLCRGKPPLCSHWLEKGTSPAHGVFGRKNEPFNSAVLIADMLCVLSYGNTLHTLTLHAHDPFVWHEVPIRGPERILGHHASCLVGDRVFLFVNARKGRTKTDALMRRHNEDHEEHKKTILLSGVRKRPEVLVLDVADLLPGPTLDSDDWANNPFFEAGMGKSYACGRELSFEELLEREKKGPLQGLRQLCLKSNKAAQSSRNETTINGRTIN